MTIGGRINQARKAGNFFCENWRMKLGSAPWQSQNMSGTRMFPHRFSSNFPGISKGEELTGDEEDIIEDWELTKARILKNLQNGKGDEDGYL